MKIRKIAYLPLLCASLVVSLLACGTEENLEDRPGGDASELDASAASDATEAGYNRPDGDPSELDDAGNDAAVAKPSVALTASSKQITAAGDLILTAAVAHSKAIKSVSLLSNGAELSTRTAAPYAWTLPLTAADNGTHVFTARATDVDGVVGLSSTVSVTVKISTPPPPIPSFVAASAPVLAAGSASVTVGTPAGVQTDDLLIALVDADEGTGARTMTTPAGWTLVGGFPIHNVATDHKPFVIPATENHGTWIFHKFAGAGEPASVPFSFTGATTSRAVMVAYRNVDKANPIHDKSMFGLFGDGDTNGLGGGNTTLTSGRQVNLIATATTQGATYTVVQTGPNRTERVNTGKQPNGLNLVISDEPILASMFLGPVIANKQSPDGATATFMFSATTLVLTPR